MKTTKKEFVEQVRNHVIECLEEDCGSTTYEILITVDLEFHNWYGEYDQKRTPNKQQAFKEFCLGLPSCFNIEYTYNGIHETMKSWFENCGEDYKLKPFSEKEIELYYRLVYREFRKVYKIETNENF